LKGYIDSMLINGKWMDGSSHGRVAVENPSTGGVITEIGYGTAEDAWMAVEAAASAFPAWSHTTARQRADVLFKVSRLLRKRAKHIGFILSQETGKRLVEAIAEVNFASEYFRWFAEEIRRPEGEWLAQEDAEKRLWVRRFPAGVALCLTPWNFPVSIQARKLAAALAAGCTVVARPSQMAPLSVIELFRCLQMAGFPNGVVNLVHGPAGELTEVLMAHPSVRVVSFTGSTSVGRSLLGQSATRMQRVTLELGGNAPFIVFDDSNIDLAVESAIIAKFRNNGQSCIAANRFFVHRRVYDEFIHRLQERVRRMRIGNPMEHTTDLGPMIDYAAKEELLHRIESAVRRGAERLMPTLTTPEIGYFISPEFLANVPMDVEFATCELFGPAAPIWSFDEDDEVLERANQGGMGLAAYVFTQSQRRVFYMTEGLEYGIVGVNHGLPSVAIAPMGGRRMSGFGREGGHIGLEEFQEIQYVSLALM